MSTIPAALQYMFAPGETFWAPLPDPGPRPTVDPLPYYIFVGREPYLVAESDVLLSTDTIFFNYEYSDFENRGTLWVEFVSLGLPTIIDETYWNYVKNYGLMVSLNGNIEPSEFHNAFAVTAFSTGVVQNHGDIVVVSRLGSAWGVQSLSIGLSGEYFTPFVYGSALAMTPFINAGRVHVWAGGDGEGAYGFVFGQGAHFVNSGDLQVYGPGEAYGIVGSLHALAVENSGNIVATSAVAGTSYGVWFANLSPYFDAVIINSGSIHADVAISGSVPDYSAHAPHHPLFLPVVHVTNTGDIIGDIMLVRSPDRITNTGLIEGDIDLGEFDDRFDSSGGSFLGALDAGEGNDMVLAGGGRSVLFGDKGFDFLSGGGASDKLNGGGASDTLHGDDGADTLIGARGNDSVFGGASNDLLYGKAGIDALYGGNGDDAAIGGAGADTLGGDDGNDVLTGNAGPDTFIFIKTGDADVVRDFAPGAGLGDVIRLVAFGAAFDTFGEVLAAASDDGADTTIDFGGGDVLILKGVVVTQLAADDFTFG